MYKIRSFRYTKQEALKEIDKINHQFKLKLNKLKLSRVTKAKKKKSDSKLKAEELKNMRLNAPKIEIIKDTSKYFGNFNL